jgi:hypothetical protein
MDFLQLPACQDLDGSTFDYILIIVCRLSGFVLGLPCKKDGLSAEIVARMFLKHVVAIFGIPHEIMSDCDHLINSRFMNTLCALAGIVQHTSIIYRPRGNGRAETAVRSVVEMLRRSLAEFPSSWIQALPWAIWQINDLPGVDGEHSPHHIVFGREGIGLGDAPSLRMGRQSLQAEHWFEQVASLRQQVQAKISGPHERLRLKFQKFQKALEYQPGDRVWVRNLPHEADKLDPLWTGPCEILSRVAQTGRYQVALPVGIQDIHSDRLRLYLPTIDGERIVLHYYRPAKDIPEDDAMVVEQILGHRVRAGQHQWKVRWKGYDQSFDSWEPASSFVGYLQMDWLQYNKDHHIQVPLGTLGKQ